MRQKSDYKPGDAVLIDIENVEVGRIWQAATVITADEEKVVVSFPDGSRLVVPADKGLVRRTPRKRRK